MTALVSRPSERPGTRIGPAAARERRAGTQGPTTHARAAAPSLQNPRPPLTIRVTQVKEIVHNGADVPALPSPCGAASRSAGTRQWRPGARGPAAAAIRCAPQGAASAQRGSDEWQRRRNPHTTWTAARDKRLETMQSAGKTAAEIAKALGTSRNAVIGRSRRLRGIVYQSDIDSWTRANARRSAEAHKRAEIRGELQSKVDRGDDQVAVIGRAEGAGHGEGLQSRRLLVADRRAFRHVAADRLRAGQARQEERAWK